MFSFGAAHKHRRPGLTPMIDVVFLLLVFFMLASRFGHETSLPISGGGAGGDYAGPPRLITVLPDAVLLNGTPQAPGALPEALAPLTQTPGDVIVLRARDGADVQRLTDLVGQLRRAGFSNLVLAE